MYVYIYVYIYIYTIHTYLTQSDPPLFFSAELERLRRENAAMKQHLRQEL